MLSGPADLDGLSRFMALITSELEYAKTIFYQSRCSSNNSIQFFIIYVPSQQLQGQLQTQHSVGTRIIIIMQLYNNNKVKQCSNHNSAQFNSILVYLGAKLNSLKANYKVSTRTVSPEARCKLGMKQQDNKQGTREECLQ
jgi:hypothetical protein